MLFNSFEFILLFLPLTLLIYFMLLRRRLTIAAKSWLLFASLFFYSWWNIKYLPLILGSILFNYTVGGLLVEYDSGRQRVSKKAIFVFGIAANIALLCWFKYMDFFIGTTNGLLGAQLPLLKIVLPLGISFFTITQIAFLVDAYEGLVEERNLLNYSLFVTFFPHLLAGPILHHSDMMPQFERMRNKVVNWKNLYLGLMLFFLGLFKKVVLADTFSVWASAGFDTTQPLTLIPAWLASLSYTFQLYFDFSGYSDMAVGIGWMFNISLPINFNSPYKATGIIDFWKRWHITLTNFVTTYLYTESLRQDNLYQLADGNLPGHADLRFLARSRLDLHHLGGDAWPGTGTQPHLEEEKTTHAIISGLADHLQLRQRILRLLSLKVSGRRHTSAGGDGRFERCHAAQITGKVRGS
jgi:alginate O-acetyltransferase complex protein AlgI